MTIVCGDSHTSTHGAFGALAHGIGTSEVEHVLATQTLIQQKAKNMLVTRRRAVAARASPPRTSSSPSSARSAPPAAPAMSRIRRRGDPRAVDGRPHDGVQHVDRGRRPRRPDRAGRKDLRICERPAARARRARRSTWRSHYWKTLYSDDDAHYDKVVRLDAAKLPPIVSLGLLARGRDLGQRRGAQPRRHRRRQQAHQQMAGARIYGADAGHEDHRHHHRARVPRLVHQWPHRGSARRRQGAGRPQGARRRQRHGGAGLGAGEGTGGGRRPRQDLQGRRVRMARAGLLDVPCDERRQAQAAGALRLDLATAISRAGRVSRAAPIWCRPPWRPRRRSPAISSTSASGTEQGPRLGRGAGPVPRRFRAAGAARRSTSCPQPFRGLVEECRCTVADFADGRCSRRASASSPSST